MPPASPLLILSVLLAFALGITLAFLAAARGQQGRFGARMGILLGCAAEHSGRSFCRVYPLERIGRGVPTFEVMAMTVPLMSTPRLERNLCSLP